ncbi:hypothetical protein [Streptomyces sp. NBC_00878]|uniref:hypothetical protein n=1 Tax=Streptomyces sp. NBC_00878 TaxID=2975854 RepID=UPI00224DF946|nr:hypothetical protein [Streptomyces sp. NBC_00878]MCX4906862.1 hypothetical protein [Streptomyces sp. NBC_00878]
MTGEREAMVEAGYAALARLQHAHEVAVESVVSEVQQHTGERLLVRRPGVLDAALGDLAAMEEQTQHYAAAMVLIRRWMLPTDRRPLGALLKVIPAQVAHEITDHLRAAGVLADGGARLSP